MKILNSVTADGDYVDGRNKRAGEEVIVMISVTPNSAGMKGDSGSHKSMRSFALMHLNQQRDVIETNHLR